MSEAKSQRLVVSSTNPVKLRAVETVVRHAFPDVDFTIESFAVESGVSDQPSSDTETRLGADTGAVSRAVPS